jgi:AbrB family looped-hinge helix DNA binding protein
MHSVITSKFQTTIPKAVRERLKLSVHDTLEWKVDRGKIVVMPVQKRFFEYRNRIKTGPGKPVKLMKTLNWHVSKGWEDTGEKVH